METADQSGSLKVPPLDKDTEEQGLRILAKIIARKLAKSRETRMQECMSRVKMIRRPQVMTDENIS